MLSQRRLNIIKIYSGKLFSANGLKKLLTEPLRVADIGYKVAKSFVFDVNLRTSKKSDENTYQESFAALSEFERLQKPHPSISFDTWLPTLTTHDVSDLADLFRIHGSDKSSVHDYHRSYGSVLRREAPSNILEIGLGTNNLDTPSNMGIWGKPGASLRAFRDWARNAKVYGADVDRRILFQEQRISTFWVDQTDKRSLDELAAKLNEVAFDLIIDDGLHLPHANLNTLSALLPLLSKNGVFVIEDIQPDFENVWRLTGAVLAPQYESYFVRMKPAHVSVFVVRRART
jgi:SAM-dependent methyltransferase